ncbi:MAG: hypothetical protein AB7U51_11685 [Arcobacter sp.]|uniref:hypothetical protein n=1 Tax=Arcobacter sp. TaxID=1872629 RepID=UPI003D02078D
MDNGFAIIVVSVIALIIGYKIYNFYEYLTMLKLKDYVKKYPNCNTGNGIKCCNCGSKSIRNWGISHANSFFRVHICNHCGVALYRS